MRQRTEVQRLAYNRYMREYRKRPDQIAIHKQRDVEKYQRWLVSATPEQKEERRLREVRSIRRARWGSPDEYAARLAKQDGLCALCGKPFDDTELGRPVQDHNHETEKLREFLHRRCNLGIGNFLDDAALCRLAAEYLERHEVIP